MDYSILNSQIGDCEISVVSVDVDIEVYDHAYVQEQYTIVFEENSLKIGLMVQIQ